MDDAIKWALGKYLNDKSDLEIANGLEVTEKEVTTIRLKLGLERKKETMKEVARIYLKEMPRSEKIEHLKKINFLDVWKMGEGQPATSGTLDLTQEPIKIDITHQLIKVYGPDSRRILDHVSATGETEQLSSGPSE